MPDDRFFDVDLMFKLARRIATELDAEYKRGYEAGRTSHPFNATQQQLAQQQLITQQHMRPAGLESGAAIREATGKIEGL